MNIYFLTDEQAKRLGIEGVEYIKYKRYSPAPANVIVDNVICTERRFVRILGRTALRILREEK